VTPPNIEFTTAPAREYAELCEQHASLTAYIEREAPELRASGEHEILAELQRIEAQMLDRLVKLKAQGRATGDA
jgi:hypothetical protein